jgi:hypothetical protein
MKASNHGNHYQQKLKTSPFGPHNDNDTFRGTLT